MGAPDKTMLNKQQFIKFNWHNIALNSLYPGNLEKI